MMLDGNLGLLLYGDVTVMLTAMNDHKVGFCIGDSNKALFEPRHEKTCLRGLRPGPTQTGLYNHRMWLKAWNFGIRK